MLITVQSDGFTSHSALPDDAQGAYWIQDAVGAKVAFAEAEANGWLMRPAGGLAFSSTQGDDQIRISQDEALILAVEGRAEAWLVICRPSTLGDKTTRIIGFAQDLDVGIGRTDDNAVIYPSQYVSSHHALLTFRGGAFALTDQQSSNGVFLNGRRVVQGVPISLGIGDVITILGLRITIGDRLISLNDPESALTVQEVPGLVPYRPPQVVPKRDGVRAYRPPFYPALRFARSVECKEFEVDAPPQQEAEDDAPLIMRVGPSLVMAMASILSAVVSVMFMMGQERGMLHAIPLFAMALAMLAGSVLWPLLNKRVQHQRHDQREAQRRGAYAQYLGKVRAALQREAKLQEEILQENRISPQMCLGIAQAQDERFMSRTPLHEDYLELRLGMGELPLKANVRFPDIRFQVQEDDLRDAVEAFAREPLVLTDVPIGHSLIKSPAMGIVGSRAFTDGFVRNLVIQACALHSHERVKVAILGDEGSAAAWSFARHLPHLFSCNKAVRFYAASLEESNALDMSLEGMLEARRAAAGFDVREAKPYLILVCPSKAIYDRSHVVKEVLACKENLGCAVIACAQHMHELPTQCRTIIGEEDEHQAYLLDLDDPTGARQLFTPDAPVPLEEAQRFVLDVSAARIDEAEGSERLPDRLSFLQMLQVSNVDHLNIADRWRESNASDTLAACIGVNASGDALMLDLHEDVHGPHGLIAGTTGSGKSELIITYVLSMALSYSPDDVAFVLIDYKGGGLAKAFDNSRFRLPHIAGTITNLDGSAIARSLASIKSELRRRQRLFNETREVIGGDNVDIYMYLDLYRQGKVTEPCPHLILIADEFAELKQQEPEFMDELISASRIGRSLGVHLILATQKPTGVVNDQIWSNARFKIALKVADAADSNEIIKRPDAAEIAQPGRFYLLVGYNEFFDKGQSGYAGMPYLADVGSIQAEDRTVSYISNIGRVLLSVKPETPAEKGPMQSQIVAVATRIVQVAARQGKQAQPLWLPSLPAHLMLADIQARFSWSGADGFSLNPVIGMLDDPANQAQGVLTVPLMDKGSALIYGSVDAGAEQVLRTLVFSALQQHSAHTLNAYLLDLGSQSLTAFAQAPQVGDVILLGDDEKVKRFFGFMSATIAQRRALFAQYGGSYARYCQKTDGCPAILVVLNGMAAFLDAYPEHEEDLVNLAREALQVGMRLVVVSETPSSVRMRLKSHFRQILACDLPDPSDHVMLFGSLQGVAVPHGSGRGLVKMDDVLYEFQAASVCPADESEYEAIAQACAQMPAGHAAPAIPLPPERVTPQMLASASVPSAEIPYGLFDDTLAVAAFDLSESPLVRCACLKSKTGASFAAALIESLVHRSEQDVAVLDMARLLIAQPAGCAFAARKDEFAIPYLIGLADQGAQSPLIIVFTGIAGFLSRCPFEDANVIKEFLKGLYAGGSVSVILVDIANDAAYSYEDWFKAHLTNRDGLWIGPGVESQSAINAAYNSRLLPDSKMHAGLGYQIEGGITRLVHVAATEHP